MNVNINKHQRYDAIDKLRGFVIVLMALDHIRDFFSPYPFQAENLDLTSPSLFFTRWITHYCAPIFIFLAGMSVFFYEKKGHSKRETTHYLLTRGLWLIFLELTWINISWRFGFSSILFAQVIWAIGWSMITLACLIHLPLRAIVFICASMVLGHNLLDSLRAENMGNFDWLWFILHEPFGAFTLDPLGLKIQVVYPLIPWVGVMGLGYCFSHWLMQRQENFSRNCLLVGATLLTSFILLRLTNVYGDSALWQAHDRGAIFTLLSFLSVTKYPPSLLYILVTVGPGLMILGLLHRLHEKRFAFLTTFGRVPFFYYMLHIPVIHVVAIIYFHFYSLSGDYIGWQLDLLVGASNRLPQGYEPNLLRVYVAWIFISVVMYVLCRAYGRLKQRQTSWIFSYL